MPTLIDVHSTVRTALRNTLKTATGFPGNSNVDWEGKTFNATVPTPWWREGMNPGMSKKQSLGPFGRIRHNGVYLIDVYVPAGRGGRNADVAAGSAMEVFPPDLMIVFGGLTVTIDRVYRSKAMVSPDWIQVPVTAEWHTYTINTI